VQADFGEELLSQHPWPLYILVHAAESSDYGSGDALT
jgi:hypothetical protein